MAGELYGIGTSGATYDFFVRNAANEVWDGTAFVAWDDADYVDYRIAAVEQGDSGDFFADSPHADATRYTMRTQAVTLAASNVVWEDRISYGPTNLELATAITTGLTTALAEGYRGTGVTGSVRDLLYEVIAHLGESAISGTTKTLKKLDGATPAKTFTLDSASTPTSITETT